jgi:hypothetical protein
MFFSYSDGFCGTTAEPFHSLMANSSSVNFARGLALGQPCSLECGRSGTATSKCGRDM